MARRVPSPRKRRTQQHIIADQSVNYVERFIIDARHSVQRMETDYGYDLILSTYDEDGYVEPGSILIQLKASDALRRSGTDYVFDLDVRDYNLWTAEPAPVILVLFDAPRRRAFWLYVQRYFDEDPSRQPRSGAKTVRVRIPMRQPVNLRAVARWREAKRAILGQVKGVTKHA